MASMTATTLTLQTDKYTVSIWEGVDQLSLTTTGEKTHLQASVVRPGLAMRLSGESVWIDGAQASKIPDVSATIEKIKALSEKPNSPLKGVICTTPRNVPIQILVAS